MAKSTFLHLLSISTCLILKLLGYCEKEISEQFSSFMKMCPDGSLSQKKFIEVSRELYGNQAKNLSESIFNIFDEDQSGHIDFVEYMMVSWNREVSDN